MRAAALLISLSLGAAGCNKGDALVVVAVTAMPSLHEVASLFVDMTAGATRHNHVVPLSNATLAKGSDTALLSAGRQMRITVALGGGVVVPPDGGAPDLINTPLDGNTLDLYGLKVCTFDDPQSAFDGTCVSGP